MSKYEIEGTLKSVADTQTFPSGFTKREFVIETMEDKYPQTLKFELVKDKTVEIDKFNPGDVLNVHFNIRGNEHNGRVFVNLQAWRIEAGASQPGRGRESWDEHDKKHDAKERQQSTGHYAETGGLGDGDEILF